jgi:hypothetical protein
MLATYDLEGQAVDSLDLKCLLIGNGLRYPAGVHEAVADWARLEPPSNPYACDCVALPGDVAVQLTPNEASPFALELDDDNEVCPYHHASRLTAVSFPPAMKYYSQKTGQGRPFGGLDVLEGLGVLAFFYMWPCEYNYYRQARREFARLYGKYGLNPPGIPAGSHVSLGQDIYRHAGDMLNFHAAASR